MSNKKILLNAFNMNCVGHINHGLWTHPRDRSADYHKLSYWTDLSRLLERGLFDGLFIADIVGTYDVYQEDFIDLVIPELQAHGAYKTSYADGTLREKLLGGAAQRPAQHAGAAFRRVPGATSVKPT